MHFFNGKFFGKKYNYSSKKRGNKINIIKKIKNKNVLKDIKNGRDQKEINNENDSKFAKEQKSKKRKFDEISDMDTKKRKGNKQCLINFISLKIIFLNNTIGQCNEYFIVILFFNILFFIFIR